MSRKKTQRRAPEPATLSLTALVASLRPSKDFPPEPDRDLRKESARRLLIIGGMIAICYVILSLQASNKMLLPDRRLEDKAQLQFEQAVEDQGRRGDLLDRNGYLLATTVALEEVHVDPSRLTPATATLLADTIGPILKKTPAIIAERLASGGRRDVTLARGLTPVDVKAVRQMVRDLAKVDKEMINAVWTVEEPHRFYPGREDAASLLGVVGRNGVGMAGLERTLDRTLRGETFRYMLWRDRKGRRVTPDQITVEGGDGIVLTLDHRIQHLAAEAILDAVIDFGAQAAHAVVVDVRTGDVLAIANVPTINPNDTADLNMTGIKNRAVMDAYEPGSVFKPFIAAAAIEEGLFTTASIIDCQLGHWTIGGKTIHDDHPKGAISLSEVIKYSSNIGSAKVAFALGAEQTMEYYKAFGFGRTTGLSLPGETRGQLRDPKTIRPIELATAAYGHGVTASSLQIAYAMATLGNGGVRMTPRLVKEVRDARGNVREVFEPEIDRRVISAETAARTVEMMSTVTETGGTGTKANVAGYIVAGKTGTAWKHIEGGGYSSTERIGSFVGIIPANDPRIAISVVVDSPSIGLSYGGIVAAPAFAHIAEGAMRLMGVAPDPVLLAAHEKPNTPKIEAPEVYAGRPARPELQWVDEGALRTPDLRGLSLREALVTLQGAGLAVRTQGTGRVMRQVPEPGVTIGIGDKVEVVLQ